MLDLLEMKILQSSFQWRPALFSVSVTFFILFRSLSLSNRPKEREREGEKISIFRHCSNIMANMFRVFPTFSITILWNCWIHRADRKRSDIYKFECRREVQCMHEWYLYGTFQCFYNSFFRSQWKKASQRCNCKLYGQFSMCIRKRSTLFSRRHRWRQIFRSLTTLTFSFIVSIVRIQEFYNFWFFIRVWCVDKFIFGLHLRDVQCNLSMCSLLWL